MTVYHRLFANNDQILVCFFSAGALEFIVTQVKWATYSRLRPEASEMQTEQVER